MHSGTVNFTHGKFILTGGVGMDIRLTQRAIWRLFEVQLMIVGAQNGPLLTSSASTGIAYRFGRR
jgi:hypothetical protein